MTPVLDGAGLLRAMRENEAQRDIPCIVMSSMPEANVRERIDGYEAFVRKPFNLDAMVQLVATILKASPPVTTTDEPSGEPSGEPGGMVDYDGEG